VLDACAAPGGKTAHLLELADVELTALDVDPARMARVEQNLERLRLLSPKVRLVAESATRAHLWWDGKPFDAVLADLPCTASGIVSRHPDIRWLRRESDVQQTAKLQREILDALWSVVAPGGKLLLATCSIFPKKAKCRQNHSPSGMCRRNDCRRLGSCCRPVLMPSIQPVTTGSFMHCLPVALRRYLR
jgi:16S rRNA (cytosine967-C5)-methyltransferase